MDTQTQWLNGALLFIPTFSCLVMMIVSLLSLRRNPPIGEELAKYVRKDELAKIISDLWDRINGDRREHSDLCIKQHADLNNIIRAFERSLGRLESLVTRKESNNGTHTG